MSSRKTISVLSLLERANKALANDYAPGAVPNAFSSSAESARAYRLGIAGFIEGVLHDSGNYVGYGYLDSPFVAGVTDESRRSYYYSLALQKERNHREETERTES